MQFLPMHSAHFSTKHLRYLRPNYPENYSSSAQEIDKDELNNFLSLLHHTPSVTRISRCCNKIELQIGRFII